MSSFDPYKPPTADVGGGPSSASTGSGDVPQAIVELMRQTRPWVTFLGILGFVVTGLVTVAGLWVIAAAVMSPKGPKLTWPLGLVYIAVGVLYIFPSLFLFRYGAAIRRLTVLGGGMESLTDALGQQKAFWRLVGIMTIVVLGLYLLSTIAGMVVAMMSVMPKGSF